MRPPRRALTVAVAVAALGGLAGCASAGKPPAEPAGWSPTARAWLKDTLGAPPPGVPLTPAEEDWTIACAVERIARAFPGGPRELEGRMATARAATAGVISGIQQACIEEVAARLLWTPEVVEWVTASCMKGLDEEYRPWCDCYVQHARERYPTAGAYHAALKDDPVDRRPFVCDCCELLPRK